MFKQSKRISVYLSLTNEVDTLPILHEMFRQNKEVCFRYSFIECGQWTMDDIGFVYGNFDIVGVCSIVQWQ